MTQWLANRSLPWAAYHALIARRLVSLDKSLGVLPVGIGKAICCLMKNMVQGITSHQTMESYGSNNLYIGLKAGIEGWYNPADGPLEKRLP